MKLARRFMLFHCIHTIYQNKVVRHNWRLGLPMAIKDNVPYTAQLNFEPTDKMRAAIGPHRLNETLSIVATLKQ